MATVLMDLEQGQVIDLLSERSAHSSRPWLRERGEVEIITRESILPASAGSGFK